MEIHIRRTLTLAVIILSVFTSALSDHGFFLFSIALICLVGIPHGATDHLLFFALIKKSVVQQKQLRLRFYAAYLGVMAGYGFLWYLFPHISFLIFILVSFYHFGQENLAGIKWRSNSVKYYSFFMSGVFVLATPLLADMEAAWPIIKTLLGNKIDMAVNFETCRILAYGTGGIYGIYLLALLATKNMELSHGLQELMHWAILLTVFISTPLLVGFAVYFSLWHAIPSMVKQIDFMKKNKLNYGIIQHLVNVAPYTIASLAGIFIGLYFLKDSSMAAQTGIGFMFLSIITLPHILLMDRFHELSGYAETSPADRATVLT